MSHSTPRARGSSPASSAAKMRSSEATVTRRAAATASTACAGPPRHATGRLAECARATQLARERAVAARPGPWSARAPRRPRGCRSRDRARAPPGARGTAPPGRPGRRSSESTSSAVIDARRSRAARRRAGRRVLVRVETEVAACSGVRQPSCTEAPARASSVATAVPQLPAPTTTAWRIGGRPPSHSHWSETHDQTRFEISWASRLARLAVERAREGQRRARSGRSPGAGGSASPGGCPRCR